MKKALILAAGLGTRLRPITESLPKAMVPILNKPIIEYILVLCLEHKIEEVVINLHYFPNLIQDYFGDNYQGMKITYSFEEELLENAGALEKVQGFFANEEQFLVIASDNIADFDLTKMSEFHKEKKPCVTIATTTADDPSKYGIVATDSDGKILLFQEKPPIEEANGDQVATCCYIFSQEIFDFIPQGKKSHFGKEIFPALLNANKPLYSFKHSGYWNDVGNPYNYRQSIYDIMDGKFNHTLAPKTPVTSIIDQKAEVMDSKINPYSVFAQKSRIINSETGKTIIYNNSNVEKSILNNCIVAENCSIKNCQLENVVLGEKCSLENISLKDVGIWPKAQLKQV